MSGTVVFIVSTLNDMARVDRGLYHFPKLQMSSHIKTALTPMFNSKIDVAIDTDGDIVGFLLTDKFAEVSHESLEEAIAAKMKEIVHVVQSAKDAHQKLEVRVKDVYAMNLRDMGITIPSLFIK